MTNPTVPYLSVAEFTAWPTYLDLDTIRVGDGSATDQASELANMLLRASAWACDEANQPLHAHNLTESRRLYTDRWGRLTFTPAHGPVRDVTALAYGYTPTAQTALTDLSGAWIGGSPDDPQNPVTVDLNGPQAGPWSGSLNFGGPVPGAPLFVTWTTLCGYANTTLTADSTLADTTLDVADRTGIQPGDVLRINEPGSEEAVTVNSTYVPATGPGVVTVAATLLDHTADSNISALPHPVKTAVVYYTCAMLLRPDVATVEEAFADSANPPTTSDGSSHGGVSAGGMLTAARRSLRRYRRVT